MFRSEECQARTNPDYTDRSTSRFLFVNREEGRSRNDGLSPDKPVRTIKRAIELASPGDTIKISSGSYNEEGLDINKPYLVLRFAMGAVIHSSIDGPVVTVSADFCRIFDPAVVQKDVVAFDILGFGCKVHNGLVQYASIGFRLSGGNALIKECAVHSPTKVGVDVRSPRNIVDRVGVFGNRGNTRGFYLSSASTTKCILENVYSAGNALAGFECVHDAGYNTINGGSSGGGDGPFKDYSGRVQTINSHFQLPSERHEHVYPFPGRDGDFGEPIEIRPVVGNPDGGGPTSAKWSDPVVLVPDGTFKDMWIWLGLNLYPEGDPKLYRCRAFKVSTLYAAPRHGGKPWDVDSDILTVADGSKFKAGDTILVTSRHKPGGELAYVNEVFNDDLLLDKPGLKWNHSERSFGSEVAYLCHREGDPSWHETMFDYYSDVSKTLMWREPRSMGDTCGVILQVWSSDTVTDNNGFRVTAVCGG